MDHLPEAGDHHPEGVDLHPEAGDLHHEAEDHPLEGVDHHREDVDHHREAEDHREDVVHPHEAEDHHHEVVGHREDVDRHHEDVDLRGDVDHHHEDPRDFDHAALPEAAGHPHEDHRERFPEAVDLAVAVHPEGFLVVDLVDAHDFLVGDVRADFLVDHEEHSVACQQEVHREGAHVSAAPGDPGAGRGSDRREVDREWLWVALVLLGKLTLLARSQ